MDTSENLDALVQGSKKLAAAIHGIVSKSTVPRSLGQIEQDSRNLSSAKERHVSTAWKLCSHVPHFSRLCSVFFYVPRGTYAPRVGQIVIIISFLFLSVFL